MAPGPKLPPDSPSGKDIKRIIREMLEKELSFTARRHGDGIVVCLALNGKRIGKEIELTIEQNR